MSQKRILELRATMEERAQSISSVDTAAAPAAPGPAQLFQLSFDQLRRGSYGTARAGFEELLRRARELPGTRAASLAGISVLSGSMQSGTIQIPGYVPPNGLRPVTYFTAVSSGYFRTLGVPLLAGRDFMDAEPGFMDAERGEGFVHCSGFALVPILVFDFFAVAIKVVAHRAGGVLADETERAGFEFGGERAGIVLR